MTILVAAIFDVTENMKALRQSEIRQPANDDLRLAVTLKMVDIVKANLSNVHTVGLDAIPFPPYQEKSSALRLGQ